MFLKIFLPKAINLLLPIAVISGGSYYAYDTYWPKTAGEWLERYGHHPIDKKDINLFEAMYVENKDEAPELSIDGNDVGNSAQKIRDWCQENWNAKWNDSLKDKLIKFCVYSPKTLRGLLIASGLRKKLITKDDDFKLIFLVHQKNINSLLSPRTQTNPEEGKKNLRRWCETNLDEKRDNLLLKIPDSLASVKNFCTVLGYSTVEEKIKKSHIHWRMVSGDDNWNSKFESWKLTPHVIKSINTQTSQSLSPTTPKEEGGKHLKRWCEEGMNKKLLDEGVYPQEYLRLFYVCKAQSDQ